MCFWPPSSSPPFSPTAWGCRNFSSRNRSNPNPSMPKSSTHEHRPKTQVGGQTTRRRWLRCAMNCAKNSRSSATAPLFLDGRAFTAVDCSTLTSLSPNRWRCAGSATTTIPCGRTSRLIIQKPKKTVRPFPTSGPFVSTARKPLTVSWPNGTAPASLRAPENGRARKK